ncbi:extracellular solute-binding protein [Rhizobium sp. KVB221]|uniref:Extracellular solute-binding protein n=1 Tax=Rhizobium setariae TaxID=2801340 RepID=A0A936YJM6_9HYPH|nr:extracellular solute-binding protein [Rhizobium setariae]MBL0371564.1 extracellular solute-binding protein [Rhizobium setariae]
MRNLVKWMAGAALAVMATAPVVASAAEVKLYHDKGFWSAQLEQVGKKAEEVSGIKIVESPYSSPEQYKAFVQSSIAGGNAPDMFTWWTGQTFNELVATGQIAPLNDVWDELVKSGQFDAGSADLFKVGNDIYGVPLLLARWVVLYNKDIFKEVGLSEPKTWDEMMQAAEKLKAAGHTPFEATVQEGWRGFIWFQELMLRTDPKAYIGINDGSVAYDSDQVRNVFKIWSDMYAKGYFSDPRSNEEAKDFASRKAAMYLMGEWATGIVDTAGLSKDKIGAFVMPNITAGLPSAVIVEGAPIVVSKAGKEKPDVMKALNFWVSAEGADAWAAAAGNYIGNVKAKSPNEVISKINSDMNAAKTASYLRWWEAVPAELQGELVAELNRFMLDPTMATAEDVMAKMQALNAEYWDSKK